jgi:hypothetical protein
MNRNTLLIVLTLAVSLAASACGSSASPSVVISTPPPASLEINGMATIAATTAHDKGAGVTWSCSPSPCGSFNPTTTLSGVTTVYTAPSTAGSVTITATSNAKSTATATASVTITPVATTASLTGTYTFYFNGYDAADGAPYSVAGSVTLDGAGNITGGEQDFFDVFTPTIITDDPITAATGAVTIGADGRGSITLTPTTAAPETLSITVVNNNHALIEEFDASATSAGSLDLQSSTAVPAAGGYAFATLDTNDAFVFGGVVTSNGSTGFTAGEADDDFQGTPDFDFNPSTGSSFSSTDAAGRGTITLNDAAAAGTLQFAYYVVGPEAFRLIEIDGFAFAAGSMYGQGTAAGSFTAASLTGSYVFGQAGRDDVGFGTYSAAGQFTTDATSTFTAGVADVNEGDGTPALAGSLTGSTYTCSALLDGYCSVALLGTTTDTLANFGFYLVDPALNVADPNNTSGGGGAVMLDLDADTLGAGIVPPQASGASFVGNFAFNEDGASETASSFDFFDFVGQVVSDGVSSYAGLADYNDVGTNAGQSAAVTVSGTFTADSANPGRSTGMVTVNGSATSNTLTFYQASSSLVVHVDVDNSALQVGTIGYGVGEQQQ